MPRDPQAPKPLFSPDAPSRPSALSFDDHRDAHAKPVSPVIAPLFDARSTRAQQAPGEPGKELFGEHGHPLLNRCFDAARQQFPELYPAQQVRIERAIRQLLPLAHETLIAIAEMPLRACGESVESLSRLTRDFTDLGAAGLMADLLDQATHKPTFIDRIADRYLRTEQAEPDYRGLLTTLKTSLQSFVPRVERLKERVDHARASLSIALAALCAVSSLDEANDDSIAARALHDRRGIVRQALQQLDLLSLQAKGFEADIVSLLTRADQLMNVTLPAALAAKQQRRH